MKILLPNPNLGNNDPVEYEFEAHLVLVGANGSGKTRLGTFIEERNETPDFKTHRISAQRALSIPPYAKALQEEQAERGLFIGDEGINYQIAHKRGRRWSNKPNSHILNDYEKLLALLFAQESEMANKYRRESRVTAGEQRLPVTKSNIDIIMEVWPEIMPQRRVSFDQGKVIAYMEGQNSYHGEEMSDGEKVTLYLLGQSLCAKEDSILIIDEPELHLHRSLMSRLWNKIEELCPTKHFVYITHDLDFAASRSTSNKIWTEAFDGSTWSWKEIQEVEGIPEANVIEILGNRRNIVFCEGEKGSLDEKLFSFVFEECHIVPRGGCQKVIESTKAMRDNPQLHHLAAYGIIDKDYRSEREVEALLAHGINTIDVAEIENLFCLSPILAVVAEYLKLNVVGTVEAVTDFVIRELDGEIVTQIAQKVEREVQYKLSQFSKSENSEAGLQDSYRRLTDSIDIHQMYSETEDLFRELIARRNLDEALKFYNRKSLSKRIAPIFGLKEGEYVPLVFRLIQGERGDEIVAVFRGVLPAI